MVLISKEGDFEKQPSSSTPQAANPEEAAGSSYEVEMNGPYPEDSFPYFGHGGWGFRGRGGGRGSPFVTHGHFNRHHHHHHPRSETVPLDDGHIHRAPHSPPMPPMPPAPPMPPVSHPDPPEAPLPPPPVPPVPPMPYGFDFSRIGPQIAGIVGEHAANWAQGFASSFSPSSREGGGGGGGGHHHPGMPWSPRHGRGFPFGRRGGGFGWSGPGSHGHWGPPFPGSSPPHHHPHPPAHFHGRWHGRHGHGHGSRLIHPNMDIVYSENTYIVTVELPGLQKSDVELGVKDGVLTISGEFPSRKDGQGGDDSGGEAPETFDYMEDDLYEDYHVMLDDEGEEITLAEGPSARTGEPQASTSSKAGPAEKGKKGKYILHERPVGKFKRSVRLPPWVDVEAIKATMSDGILTLVLEKPAPERKDDKTHRINIL